MLDLCHENGLNGWALIPTGDETAAFVARRHATLSRYFTLTTPPWDVFRWAYDKRLTNQLADDLDIEHPRTWYPTSSDELAALDAVYPAILKPAYKITLNHFTIAKAWQVNSSTDLIAKYDAACAHATPEAVMVQEIIPGGGQTQLSYAALADNGRVLASVTAQRTRQYPMDFGRASTFVETISDEEVERKSRRLIRAMNYTGLVEVEFKRDPRDNQLKLLDVNPRVWGWHTLGRRAGVDFPYLLWMQVFGQPLTEPRATLGVRWVRGLTDLPTVLKEIRAKRMGILQYLSSIRPPAEWAVLAFDDPAPALFEIPDTLRIIVRRGKGDTDSDTLDATNRDQKTAAERVSRA